MNQATNTQPRLHITSGAKIKDNFMTIFPVLESAAATIQGSAKSLTLAQVWELAQYVDLADAGYGRKTALLRSVKAQLKAFVTTNLLVGAVRTLSGRSAILTKMVDTALDAAAEAPSEANLPMAA